MITQSLLFFNSNPRQKPLNFNPFFHSKSLIFWFITSNGAIEDKISALHLGCTFKLTDFTFLEDIKEEIHYLLPYGDNRKIVKLENHSPSIDNIGNIEFNKFELKTQSDVRTMWNTYFRFETKVLLELETTISRSIKDILNISKRSTWILKCSVAFYVELIYVILILFSES
ncbi:hypothetical protein KIW84_054869 [Lathyrus oleraceus]|uniref:Uncharacterized protein n=1 Tax=Pisum sativum TaxID=3888 RepID=A0A9D4WX75_PEA|nr:hypothetical protein KIW84_054869 [Pisum sativum]